MVMKSDRKRMQKEEEMEKQTKIKAGAVKTSNCMDVDSAFSTILHTVGEFTAIELTQRKLKKNQAKTLTREKK